MRQYRVVDVYWADLVDTVCVVCEEPMRDPQPVVTVYVCDRPVENVPRLASGHVKCLFNALREGV
ncbi:MAG: hypothetical protein QXS50_02510 [Candidatus Caldarchaeum sp.]